MTPALWVDLAWLVFVLACCGAAAVLSGFLIHWCLELRDLRRAARGTIRR